MKKNRAAGVAAGVALVGLVASAGTAPRIEAARVVLAPATMKRIATVDERFQSYNVEMAEVVGGRFWKPYTASGTVPVPSTPPAAPNQPGAAPQVGLDPNLFQARPPIDLSNVRLRTLAAALGPAYMRVSGTWANSTYFHDSDDPAPAAAPPGFQSVLTRAQWAAVIRFAQASKAALVSSFAISNGTRDAAGAWTPDEARKLLAFTKSAGGEIVAAEFFNEPTFAAMGGAPPGYDAARFARDFAVFRGFVKMTAPGMRILGPGSVGEGISLTGTAMPGLLKTGDLLAAAPRPVFDVFSYHFYGAVSMRCASLGTGMNGTTPDAALSEDWLARTETVQAFYAALRDQYAPGTPMWLTETADAACGGNPWAVTFVDSFRYLEQLGRLARRGVKTVFHNTLAASEYGLIDQQTLTPRPNYWAAVLWHRLMAPTVLDAATSASDLHLYAHCLPGHPGGVTVLAINTNRTTPGSIDLPVPADRYTLSAEKLEDRQVQLNGRPLAMLASGGFPALDGSQIVAGPVTFAPASITFLAMPERATRPAGDRGLARLRLTI